MTRRASIAFALIAASMPALAHGDPFPTWGGQSGILDVPDAEIALPGAVHFGTELRYAGRRGATDSLGPLAMSVAAGLLQDLEFGFAVREGGRPGDPRPAPALFEAAAKYNVLRPRGLVPGLAVSARVDRINWAAEPGLRIVGSTGRVNGYRGAAFAGSTADLGMSAGLAGSLRRSQYEGVAEVTADPGGVLIGVGGRWIPSPKFGIGATLSWLPGDGDVVLGITVGYNAIGKLPEPPKKKETTTVVEQGPEQPEERVFRDARPHFRLKIRRSRPSGATGGRHLHYAPAPAKPEQVTARQPVERTRATIKEIPRAPQPVGPAPPAEPPVNSASRPAPTPPTPTPTPKPTPTPAPPTATPTPPHTEPTPPAAGGGKTEETRERRAPVEQPPEPAPGGPSGAEIAKALEKAQPAIRRCISRYLKRSDAVSGRATLIVHVATSGDVAGTALHDGPLRGTLLERCVRDAAWRWRFPKSDETYDVSAVIVVRTNEAGR